MGKYDFIKEPNTLDVEMLRQIDFLQTLTKDEIIGRYIERITKLDAGARMWKFATLIFALGLLVILVGMAILS